MNSGAPAGKPSNLNRLIRLLGWSKSSFVVLGLFLLIVLVILYIWWPLTQMVIQSIDWHGHWWKTMDWLLVGIFLFMTLVIMTGADLRRDAFIILVGAVGGLVIEGWGTQTYLWWYFTAQRPPLWIIPAWPIASLTIDRMVRLLNYILPQMIGKKEKTLKIVYWVIFLTFLGMMVSFTLPYLSKTLTWMALLLVMMLVISPGDKRWVVLTFICGAGLGYFLELWGTTRQCWTYYTLQTPPLFAVLAHGMAAVAFWRSGELLKMIAVKLIRNPGLIKSAKLSNGFTRLDPDLHSESEIQAD